MRTDEISSDHSDHSKENLADQSSESSQSNMSNLSYDSDEFFVSQESQNLLNSAYDHV